MIKTKRTDMGLNQNRTTSRSKDLIQFVIALFAGVFLAQLLDMVIHVFYRGPYNFAFLLDAILTTVLLIPILYFSSYRPLLKHVAERERVEKIMQSRLRLMQLADHKSLDEILQITLDEIEVLTGSTIGFFHFLEADQQTLSLQAWSTNTLSNLCTAEGKGSHYPVTQAGVWADSIRQQRTIIHNDFPSLPHRKGQPEGHAPIQREITIPILRDQKVVAILGMGNKPSDYTTEDAELISTLADFAWDIIDRKLADIALRKSEENFRTLVDWTYDWELWVDPQRHIVYTSPSCERITGYAPMDFLSDPDLLLEIVHPEDRLSYQMHRRLIHDETAGTDHVEYRILAQDGSEHWIDHICRPLFGNDGRYLGRRISNRDVSTRKRAEIEIEKRNKKEKILTEMLHKLQIDIARDLHDTIGQNISYLRMKLEHLSEVGPQSQLDLDHEINMMSKVANESYDLIRGTLAVLQSGGIVDPHALFTQYSEQVQERSNFEIVISILGNSRPLTPNQVRQLFFVFREALNNVEKHAKARKVSVEFNWAEEFLTLMIVDDGDGFPIEDAPDDYHYGLKFMRERIEMLSGTWSIHSTTGMGTQIEITMPYGRSQLEQS